MANRVRDEFRFPPPPRLNGALVASSNGNGKHAAAPSEQKDVAPLTVLRPAVRDFWLPGNPELERYEDDVTGISAYRLAALAYICIRYRATKIREAPLMVVEETEEGEEWIENHALNPLLARPNPDYGMARLIEATETYLCLTGRCLWVKNRTRGKETGSLYPFSGDEFTIERANGRLFGRFRVGDRPIAPEDAVYFSYFSPEDPHGGAAPLDAALRHLNIGQALAHRVKSHVRNAMTPGGVYVADKDWRSTDEEFQRLKDELANMFRGANAGKPAIAEGGGQILKGWSLADLALGELWKEVEATVCACFGVPASLVGTLVGLENSPWSHLETAKKSFYDETVLPEWELIAEVVTESLLRESDADPGHLVRFDTSRIRALRVDVAAAAVTAATAQRWTTVNERRLMMGLKKSDDPKADAIPELTAPTPTPVPDQTNPADGTDVQKRRRAPAARKAFESFRLATADFLHAESTARWEHAAAEQLAHDQEAIARAVEHALAKKETAPSRRQHERAMLAAELYLEEESKRHWARVANPLLRQTAESALVATVVPDTAIEAQLLRPHLESFIQREAAFLVTNVTETTKDAVRTALTDGMQAGEGVNGLAKRIRDLTAFARDRAKLIARTESTRTLTGAPLEALNQYGETTGQRFTKTWLATLDDRVRDEHRAMHGETVAADAQFSNGLTHPGEPNCRCSLTYGVEGVAA